MRLSNMLLLASNSFSWPGQPGNPVGFAAAPGYPGSLTTFSGSLTSGTSGAHRVYSFMDFNSGGFPNLSIGSGLQYIDFVGCRFQSNANTAHPAAPSSSNIEFSGTNITFSYCSWTPLFSKYGSFPPNYGLSTAAWPASGAGHNTVTQIGGTTSSCNAVAETDAYTYGILINGGGPLTLTSCDFWGFGNCAIDFSAATTAQLTVNNCWIHDNAAVGSVNKEHLDAIGFLQGTNSIPENITITNSTLACIGNNGSGDCLAWQGGANSSAVFNNINHIHNYISGYGYTIILAGGDLNGTFTNSQFINNVIGTDVQAYWGFLYQDGSIRDYSPMFSSNGNSWYGNTLRVLPGSTYSGTADTRAQFTSADNGLFFLPNGTYSTTDFAG